jgi:hypothetical protein
MSDGLRGSVFGNAGTKIVFGVSAEDAEYLAPEVCPVSAQQLTTLSDHEVYVKGRIAESSSEPLLARTLAPAVLSPSYRDQIVSLSRQRYARPRIQVEQALARGMPPPRRVGLTAAKRTHPHGVRT